MFLFSHYVSGAPGILVAFESLKNGNVSHACLFFSAWRPVPFGARAELRYSFTWTTFAGGKPLNQVDEALL